MKEFEDFSEIFRKNMTYNLKNYENQGFNLSVENAFLICLYGTNIYGMAYTFYQNHVPEPFEVCFN